MIRALIFDFDGLILDTEVPDFESWQEIYAEHGCTLPFESWSGGIGTTNFSFNTFDYLASLVQRPLDRETLHAQHRRRYLEMVEAQAILPGVEDTIVEAKRLGLKIGVASSARREWVVGHLSRLGLEAHFACVKSSNDVRNTKPDPELYLAALEALDVLPEEAIALEDSPNGVAAAKSAGMFCVAVPNALTGQLDLSQADLQLASLADMPLEQLLAEAEKARR
jgi:HAD superfamily hydrolase (TIGR01509 family)